MRLRLKAQDVRRKASSTRLNTEGSRLKATEMLVARVEATCKWLKAGGWRLKAGVRRKE